MWSEPPAVPAGAAVAGLLVVSEACGGDVAGSGLGSFAPDFRVSAGTAEGEGVATTLLASAGVASADGALDTDVAGDGGGGASTAAGIVD